VLVGLVIGVGVGRSMLMLSAVVIPHRLLARHVD
jgi:hypothetical protein